MDIYLQAAIAEARKGLAEGGIPKVVVGENRTFQGPEEYLRLRGVELSIVDSAECRELMSDFIRRNPELWNEDIGE